MRYGRIPGIDKPVSRLIQGTAMVDGSDEAQEFALLDAVLELGCTAFDTAHVYANGANERAVGRWIHSRGVRDRVVIVGKGAHHNADRRRVTPFDISADLHDSLARFGVDTIDLYLLHRDDPDQPVGPIVEVLNEHLAAGRIRAFGGSNWTHERLREANAYAEARGLTPFVVSSPNFSLAEQVREPWPNCLSIGGPSGESARLHYRDSGMALLTWSSLAGGFFSGRFRRDNLDAFEEYLDRLCVASYAHEANFARLERAEAMARERGLTLPQVALAYVLSQPQNIFALVGCRAPAEFEANVAALAVELGPGELRWLERGERAPAA